MVQLTFVFAAAGVLVLVYVIQLYVDFKRYEVAMGCVMLFIRLGLVPIFMLTMPHDRLSAAICLDTDRCCRQQPFWPMRYHCSFRG